MREHSTVTSRKGFARLLGSVAFALAVGLGAPAAGELAVGRGATSVVEIGESDDFARIACGPRIRENCSPPIRPW